MTAMKKGRGLKALVQDAVEHGTRAVERVHMQTAGRWFTILEHLPVISTPTRIVRVVHDVSVTTTYEAIRLVNRAVGVVADAALDAAEAAREAPPDTASPAAEFGPPAAEPGPPVGERREDGEA